MFLVREGTNGNCHKMSQGVARFAKCHTAVPFGLPPMKGFSGGNFRLHNVFTTSVVDDSQVTSGKKQPTTKGLVAPSFLRSMTLPFLKHEQASKCHFDSMGDPETFPGASSPHTTGSGALPRVRPFLAGSPRPKTPKKWLKVNFPSQGSVKQNYPSE